MKRLIYVLFFVLLAGTSVPFLSYGLTGTVANSILVGILLGIIRNRNVLYEKESGPAVIPDTGTV